MAEIYVPNYMSFHNDNTFLGSYRGVRFKLTPDLEEETIRAEYWFGPLCYEKSTMDGDTSFPLTEAGIAEMTRFLEGLAEPGPEEA